MNLSAQDEPIRRNLYVAGAVIAIASLAAVLGVAETWTPQVIALAISSGLAEFALIVFGVERARDKAWAPASVDQEVTATRRLVDDVLSAEAALSTVEPDDVPTFDAPDDDRL